MVFNPYADKAAPHYSIARQLSPLERQHFLHKHPYWEKQRNSQRSLPRHGPQNRRAAKPAVGSETSPEVGRLTRGNGFGQTRQKDRCGGQEARKGQWPQGLSNIRRSKTFRAQPPRCRMGWCQGEWRGCIKQTWRPPSQPGVTREGELQHWPDLCPKPKPNFQQTEEKTFSDRCAVLPDFCEGSVVWRTELGCWSRPHRKQEKE